jgi:hypothetical protein
MKKVIFAVVLSVVCASALEMKPVKLSPVDGQVFKNGVWIVK